jgi:hypothetical protein
MKYFLPTVAALLLCLVPLPAVAQEQPSPPDGPHHIFQDTFLAELAGPWKMSGTIRGQSVDQTVDAQWVLNHQFLQLLRNFGLRHPLRGSD